MGERIIEIEQEGRFLSLERGFLVVADKEQEIGKIPLDDLLGVVIHAYSTLVSHNLLSELLSRNISVIFCDKHHMPSCMLWPVSGNYRQSARMRAQAGAAKPLCKRLWQQTVRMKILNQSKILKWIGNPSDGLELLASDVRSGDPDNLEAQAAMRYWPRLFGASFVRRNENDFRNSLLNYGYAVLRAAVARFIMGAGLHPSLGIHHENAVNPMPLVDDLMEPYRPFVDWIIFQTHSKECGQLDAALKKDIVSLLQLTMITKTEETNLTRLIERCALSLGQVYEGARDDIDFGNVLSIQKKQYGEAES